MNDHSCPLSPVANSGNPEEQMDDDAVDEFMNYQPESKKRRLTVDQVRSLEKSFEMETKLEPEKKIQLAQELGLQPRQVAVWFQNRRARWKTKQLERDYNFLKASYDTLKSDFEGLQKEKGTLLAERILKCFQFLILWELQLERLKGKLMEAECCKGDDPNSTKETSIVENSNNVEVDDTGGESNIDIKPFSDITLLFKEKDTGMEKIDVKPLRVLLLNEKEGFFSPDFESSGNMLPEDKKPPHQIFTQLAQSSSSMKYPSANNNTGEGSHEQGLMHLAEALCGMGIPSKACQQLFRIDEGYLHEEACNIFVNVEEQGASSSLPWWDYWL